MGGRNSNNYKCISRCEYRSMHGYFVRIGWKRRRYQKYFPFRDYETEGACFAAAIAWRDMIEIQIGKPRTERCIVGYSSTGAESLIGVRVVEKSVYTRTGEVSSKTPVVEITGPTKDGRYIRTSISINKHGNVALSKAVERRKEIFNAFIKEAADA